MGFPFFLSFLVEARVTGPVKEAAEKQFPDLGGMPSRGVAAVGMWAAVRTIPTRRGRGAPPWQEHGSYSSVGPKLDCSRPDINPKRAPTGTERNLVGSVGG